MNPADKPVLKGDPRLRAFFHSAVVEKSTGPIYESLDSLSMDYEEYIEIASGGMKTVYSVHDCKADRRVAMATLKEGAGQDEYESFLREARLTARLDHPNIIKVHDVGLDENNMPYFTMDLKSGRTLKDYMKPRPSSLHERLVIFLKICDAVSYAHSKGVLHLDLKPENIQVGDFGEVLICDWGLGEIFDNESFISDFDTGLDLFQGASSKVEIRGTPGFMAPEQISGNEPSEQTDIFSLGVILYHLLCFRSPYHGNWKNILHQTGHFSPDPPSLRNKRQNIPSSLDAVNLKAMEIDPEDRYYSVAEMAQDVNSFISGFATEAENASFWRQFTLSFKRHKGIFSVAVVAVVGTVLLTWIAFHRIQSQKEQAIEQRDRANDLSKSEAEAREQAETSAAGLEREKRNLKAMNSQYVNDLTKQSIFVSQNLNYWGVKDKQIFENTLELLRKAVEADENAVQAKEEMASLLFIMQRYRESLAIMNELKTGMIIRKACEKGAEFKKKKKIGCYELCVLINTIDSIPVDKVPRKIIIDHMISYDHFNVKRSLEERLKITVVLVKVWNPEWNIKGFEFNSKKREVTLKGMGLYNLRTKRQSKKLNRQNVLRLINPSSIILQNCGITELDDFYGLALKKLDIRDSKIKSVKGLSDYKGLSKLVLSKNQLKDTKVPSWLDVELHP